MRFNIVAILIASCASQPTIRSDEREPSQRVAQKSGTRLKVRYYVGADGSEQAVGFFDTVRKENCTVMMAADGVLRCVPEAHEAYWATRAFADSACTQEVFQAACQASYARKAVAPNTCNSGWRIFPLGARFTGQLYEDDPTAVPRCTKKPPATASVFEYRMLGAEVAPSTFQSVTEVVR